MVKCESCGADLSEGAKFCSNCGVPIGIKEEFTVRSEDLVAKIKELIHEGDISRIIVKDENGKTLLEIPAWAGIVGTILAPWLAALGAIAALATRCTITVIRQKASQHKARELLLFHSSPTVFSSGLSACQKVDN